MPASGRWNRLALECESKQKWRKSARIFARGRQSLRFPASLCQRYVRGCLLKFAKFWADYQLFEHTHGTKRFFHEAVGEMQLNYEALPLPGDHGQTVVVYTAVLGSDTAVPAWHEGYRELPFVFAGSAAVAAGGLGLMTVSAGQNAPARNLALLGAGTEAVAFELMTRRMGMVAEPYSAGRGGGYIRAAKALSVLGTAGALLGRRNRALAALSGAALLGASAATRWGMFHAGLASARDPKYTVVPQRERLRSQAGGAPQR